jgi:hypothetical protein
MDQGKFINTYIETVINSIIENVKVNLQLQTQVKVNEFVVAEKDQIIAALTQQINENKVAEDWKVKYESAETNYNAILGKLSHMDILLGQMNEMKKIISQKDIEIETLTNQLDELKNPKKALNIKTKKIVEEAVKQEKITDDF